MSIGVAALPDPASSLTITIQVSSSNEVDLGDDEDPESIRAMIRHIYDLAYDQMLQDDTAEDSSNDELPFPSLSTNTDSTNEDLLFHIGVFTAADKYDVASLRPLVVRKLEGLMETNWESESFATSIKKLTGPSAGHVADNSLQIVAAKFCATNLTDLIKNESFVKMIHEEEPFTGRLLTGFLNGGYIPGKSTTVQTKTCKKLVCRYTKPSESTLQCLTTRYVVCGTHANQSVRDALSWDGVSGLVDYKQAHLL
jgi:hypothetical protein